MYPHISIVSWRFASSFEGSRPQQSTVSYLHPYYDAVLRNKLRLKPKHAKELIEIQWEATRGSFYTKPPNKQPVLALYVLDDTCCLMLEIPGGVSKYCCLDGRYYVDAVRRASADPSQRLPMPEEIQEELIRLKNWQGESMEADRAVHLNLRWKDPVSGLPEQLDPSVVVARKPAFEYVGMEVSEEPSFPMVLPDGLLTN